MDEHGKLMHRLSEITIAGKAGGFTQKMVAERRELIAKIARLDAAGEEGAAPITEAEELDLRLKRAAAADLDERERQARYATMSSTEMLAEGLAAPLRGGPNAQAQTGPSAISRPPAKEPAEEPAEKPNLDDMSAAELMQLGLATPVARSSSNPLFANLGDGGDEK